MREKTNTSSSEKKLFRIELAKQMLTLATASFGLVAALAWNEAIKALLTEYLRPYLPGSGIISLFIYAIIVTVLAVIVTTNLTKAVSRLEQKDNIQKDK